MTTKFSGRRKLTKKVRFPGLDLVRSFFLVQLIVVVSVAWLKEGAPLTCDSSWSEKCFVSFQPFFVLMGFLSSYHLLAEKRRFGSFHILYYFIRRALMVLPFYFILLLLASMHLFGFGMDCHSAGEFIAMVTPLTSASHASLTALPGDPVFFAMIPLSLAIIFYLIWPIFMWLIPVRQHLWLEVSLLTIALLFRAGLFTGEIPVPWHPMSVLLPLMLGALLAQQVHLYPSSFLRFRSYRNVIRLLSVGGGVTCLIWYFAIAEDNHIRVLLELIFSISALMLVAIESVNAEEKIDGRQPSMALVSLPFTVGAAGSWDLFLHLFEIKSPLMVMMLSLASGALFAFIALHFTSDRLLAWKEEFTFSAKK